MEDGSSIEVAAVRRERTTGSSLLADVDGMRSIFDVYQLTL
jgi:hypothetical protein